MKQCPFCRHPVGAYKMFNVYRPKDKKGSDKLYEPVMKVMCICGARGPLSESWDHDKCEKLWDNRPLEEELIELLRTCRAWVNDECERRGDEDAEYENPACSMVEAIDAAITKATEQPHDPSSD